MNFNIDYSIFKIKCVFPDFRSGAPHNSLQSMITVFSLNSNVSKDIMFLKSLDNELNGLSATMEASIAWRFKMYALLAASILRNNSDVSTETHSYKM